MGHHPNIRYRHEISLQQSDLNAHQLWIVSKAERSTTLHVIGYV